MITSLRLRNFKTFAEEIEISFTGSFSIKRFLCNTFETKGKRVLKTIGFYGPNNTGKTCLILALANLRALMLNESHEDLCNSFIENNVTYFKVEYIIKDRMYSYDVSYDNKEKKYIREELNKLTVAPSNSSMISSKTLIVKDKNGVIFGGSKNGSGNFGKETLMKMFSPSLPILKSLEFAEDIFPDLYQAQKDYIEFASSIILVRNDKHFLDIRPTLELIKNDLKARKFISEFIKNSDLHISDFGFSDNIETDVDVSNFVKPSTNLETLKFYSVHKGYKVPSFIFDSLGTQKIIALSGYIYQAIKNGGILLIDEIDGSLHHILTRAIISLFNNDLNKRAQLVFTTHDLLLLDLEKLFRKDQIYLTNIHEKTGESVLVHLSDITSKDEDGIRGDEDIRKHYLHGRFGKLPSPELFDVLEETLDEQ